MMVLLEQCVIEHGQVWLIEAYQLGRRLVFDTPVVETVFRIRDIQLKQIDYHTS